MKQNKKLIIAIPIIIAVSLFIGLFVYFNREDSILYADLQSE